MNYQSTRDYSLTARSSAAVLRGIAPDGGLYILKDFSALNFDWRAALQKDTLGMAEQILSALLPDFPDMGALVRRAYNNKFETEDLTPLVPVGDRYVLELFRGPTSAFKDVALSMLPQLITAARGIEGIDDEIVILTATSGDTGKAALEGFHDVEGTRIIVFFPEHGVSAVQKAQMVTQEGANVCSCGIEGNFDDAQTGVKNVFAAVDAENLLEGKGARLSSANSINIGRLAPQVVYYFKAYADLVRRGTVAVGDPVDFVVPTGNFGDILAGYFAKMLGLPVGKLVCASNKNNILTDFLQTGVYDRNRPFYKTVSPSMDILVSSNLERLLFLLSGDAPLVSRLMASLSDTGAYRVPDDLKAKLDQLFFAGCCDDDGTKAAIGRVWREHGYLMDTHTAVAYHVAQQYKAACPDHAPVVILSTASPYKFPAAVLEALGEKPEADEFEAMARVEELTAVPMPKNLRTLRERSVRHRDVIERSDMLQYVLDKAIQEKW